MDIGNQIRVITVEPADTYGEDAEPPLTESEPGAAPEPAPAR